MLRGLSYTVGPVPGPFRDEPMVCQFPHMSNAQGSLWLGHNPLSYTTPVLLLQFILLFIISRLLYFFLQPLQQNLMSAQILAGIIMGQSILSRNINYAMKVLPLGGKSILSTAADVGLDIHLFILGVQTDTSVIKKAGKSGFIIAITGFLAAFVLSSIVMFILTKMTFIDHELYRSLISIITLAPMSSFPVVTSLCADLSILNSELGQIASSASMICDLFSLSIASVIGHIGKIVKTGDWTQIWALVWTLGYIIFISFVFRPCIIRIGKTIPEGKQMGETQLMSILSIVLFCAFSSEFMGYHSGVGAFILGLAVPDGPPLGDNLVYKLEAMSSGLFLPAKFGISGMDVNIISIRDSRKVAVLAESLIISGFLGKLLGTLVSALFCELPMKDALALSLIMSCRGLVDIALYCLWKDTGLLGDLEYTLLIVSMLILTGIARPLISYLYDPSKRYKVHIRSSLLEYHHRNAQPRILVTIHKEENVPTIINLLEASNPIKCSCLSVFILNLKELKGRATSMLAPNFKRGKFDSTLKHSEHIVNAFAHYENHPTQGNVLLQHFTAISPYASMHDDICNLALDKRVSIVILPFHKQWDIDSTVGAIFPSIRMVNRNVLNKAPCSVGVLVDRSHIHGGNWTMLADKSVFRIALLFLGGMDGREAFAYARRMLDHHNVTLYMVWIRQRGKGKEGLQMDETIDVELMEDFRTRTKGNTRVVFREETVDDVVGTTGVIHSIEDIGFDLFVVGRYHDPSDPRVLGLTDWSECPELGVIGDMLTTSDFTFSVLVVQQQPMGDVDTERSFHMTKIHPDRDDHFGDV